MAEGSVEFYSRSGVRVSGVEDVFEALQGLVDDALEAYAKRLVKSLERILPARSPVRTGRLAGGWRVGLIKQAPFQYAIIFDNSAARDYWRVLNYAGRGARGRKNPHQGFFERSIRDAFRVTPIES